MSCKVRFEFEVDDDDIRKEEERVAELLGHMFTQLGSLLYDMKEEPDAICKTSTMLDNQLRCMGVVTVERKE